MDIQPIAKNMIRGLLEKNGPRMHAYAAFVTITSICLVFVLFAVARYQGKPLASEYTLTLAAFGVFGGYVWKTGKNMEDGPDDPTQAPAPDPGAKP